MGISKYETTWVNLDEYQGYLEFVDIFDSRKFYSKGKNGIFEMRTMITRLKRGWEAEFFNLGFGVWDDARQILDDTIQTKNGDMPEILATVAQFALDFLKKNPSVSLYAEGSTYARTRLYQREISKIVDDMPPELCLHGMIIRDDIGFAEFQRGINFDAFLLSVK